MSISVNINDPINNGVSTSSKTSGTTATGTNSASDLQGSFLTLLVAQLKNQDPTNAAEQRADHAAGADQHRKRD